MRKSFALIVCVLLGASSCIGGGGANHTVLVDYSSDEFATFILRYFPKHIEAHPGDSLVVHQTWTGEPHTFTGGTLYNKTILDGATWFNFFDAFGKLQGQGEPLPDPENAGDATVADLVNVINGAKDKAAARNLFTTYAAVRRAHPKLPPLEAGSQMKFSDLAHAVDDESNKVFESFPSAIGDNGDINQFSAQPCFLRKGRVPKSRKKPCAKANQEQPAFDGKQALYSSGIIPYSGPQGDTFRVPLAKNIKPGQYFFFCLVHGPGQHIEVDVKPKSAKIESAATASRRAKSEIDAELKPLRRQWNEAHRGKLTLAPNEVLTPPFAGLMGVGETAINEFVPKTVHAKVNEPIVWKMTGAEHTISFNPPKYFPPIQFQKNGTVRFNPRLQPPAGGAKKFPEQKGQPTGPVKFDGGTYDGTGFWSTGLIGAQPYIEYTVRVSKPGTYHFACLIHPPMVGTLVVSR